MKALPLAYNKDMQEDKEALFDAIDTVKQCLLVYEPMLRTARFKSDKMLVATRGGFTNATDLADYLAAKGMPFRDAHEAVALAVRAADVRGVDLPLIPLADLRTAMAHVPGAVERLGDDVFQVLTVEGSLAARNHVGGTAPAQVRAAITRARGQLA